MSWRGAGGLRPWLLQRLSALYLAFFLIFLFVAWGGGVPANYAAWRAWVAQPLVNIAIAVFILALLGHAWVGTRDVIMDYVKPLAGRLVLLTAFGLLFLGSLLWSFRVLVSVVVA